MYAPRLVLPQDVDVIHEVAEKSILKRRGIRNLIDLKEQIETIQPEQYRPRDGDVLENMDDYLNNDLNLNSDVH